jgi:hypothetical protein
LEKLAIITCWFTVPEVQLQDVSSGKIYEDSDKGNSDKAMPRVRNKVENHGKLKNENFNGCRSVLLQRGTAAYK